MKNILCLLFAVGCGVEQAEDGVSGRFETVRYETVHIGDSIAARFTTLDGQPIVTSFEESAVPSGWTDDGGPTIDARSFAPSIARALDELAVQIESTDLHALESAGALVAEKHATSNVLGMRHWSPGCAPKSSHGGEYAEVAIFNGGSTKSIEVRRYYGVRSGSIYSSNYTTSLGPSSSRSITLSVSNGANVLDLQWWANPVDSIYRGATSDSCW